MSWRVGSGCCLGLLGTWLWCNEDCSPRRETGWPKWDGMGWRGIGYGGILPVPGRALALNPRAMVSCCAVSLLVTFSSLYVVSGGFPRHLDRRIGSGKGACGCEGRRRACGLMVWFDGSFEVYINSPLGGKQL